MNRLISGIASVASAIAASLSLTACNTNTLHNAVNKAVEPAVSAINTMDDDYTFTQYGPTTNTSHEFDNLYSAINNAKKSVYFQMYSLNDPQLFTALANAKKRGVDVRVSVDQAFGGNRFNQTAMSTLTAANVPVKFDPTGVIYHAKYLVADNKTLIVSTANNNAKDYSTFRDAAITTVTPGQVNAASQTFLNDWNATGTTSSREVHSNGIIWSPGAANTMTQIISNSKSSLYVESEEMNYQPVIDAIVAFAKTGKSCTILGNNEKSYLSAYQQEASAGCHVYLTKSSKLYIHEKAIVSDGKTVLLGSQNIGSSSLNRNRELGIVVSDTKIASAVTSQFDADSHSQYATVLAK